MHNKLNTTVAILLFTSVALACSSLPSTRSSGWHLTLEIDAPAGDREALVNRTVSVIESRLNALGISNAHVQTQGAPGNGRILVSLPDVPDRERLKSIIISEGRLELTAIISPPSPALVQTYDTQKDAAASLVERASPEPPWSRSTNRPLPAAQPAG